MNSKEANIRKQQSILICSGMAMIIFGIWSIIRIVLLRFIDPDHFSDYILSMGDTSDLSLMNLILVIFIILLLFDLFIKTYIGISAIKEGNGKLRSRITYIVIAILCLTISVGSDISFLFSLSNQDFADEYFLATIIDISIHIATLEVIIAAIRLRKLMKENVLVS